MPIDIRVLGDPQSCSDCADSLASLAAGVHANRQSFVAAVSQSEREWRGEAGDEFRTRIGAMEGGTDVIAAQAGSAARALRSFADGLAAVTTRMRQAVEIATRAGLPVTPEMIGDPIDVDPTQSQAMHARQAAAYDEALEMAVEGRDIEQVAHTVLEQSLSAVQVLLDDAQAQWYWLTAFTI